MVYFGLFQENSVCFGCFDTGPKHRNKPKKKVFGFAKQTENNRNRLSFGLFRFEPKKKFDCFEDTLAAGPPFGFTTDRVSCWGGEPCGELKTAGTSGDKSGRRRGRGVSQIGTPLVREDCMGHRWLE